MRGAGAGKPTAQHYGRGELCDGAINRVTTVYMHCSAGAAEPVLRSAREVSMCVYELHLDTREWCQLVAAGVVEETLEEEEGGEGEEGEEGEEEEEGGEEGAPGAARR